MDIPIHGSSVGGTAPEYLNRILHSKNKEAQLLLDKLYQTCYGRPHAIFRVNYVYILVRLLKIWDTENNTDSVKLVAERLNDVVKNNMSYWSGNKLASALCHLDNATLRVADKLCKRFNMERFKTLYKERKKVLAAEDFIKGRYSVAGDMVASIAMTGEHLWRQHCSNTSENDIWDGIWYLEALEKVVDEIEAPSYPDRDGDGLFFNSYGRGYDMLVMGTWGTINGSFLADHPAISDSVKQFVGYSREEALSSIPTSKPCPDDWQPPESVLLLTRQLKSSD